ncbi:MAG: hypothetical protein MJZ34_08055 [Paludibacteraceae bacterium]|nr:hypothetical protein [Paludibacteraceae bacterium]
MKEKKDYIQPNMEVIEMSYDTQLLASSDGGSWFDGKPDSVCGHGHNPHCIDD